MIKYLKYYTKYKLSILTVMISIIITVSTSLLGPIYIGKAITAITENNGLIIGILTTTIIIYLLNAVSLWATNYLTNLTAEKVAFDLRNKLFNKLFKLYDNYFFKNSEGNIASCFTNDIEKLTEGANLTISAVLIGIITVFFATIIIFSLNITLAIIVIISAPICLIISSIITKNMQKYFKKQANTLADINDFALENIDAEDLLHTFNGTKESIDTFNQKNEKLRESSQKAYLFSSLVNPTTRIVNNVLYCLLALVGSILVIRGDITIGILTTFLLYGNLFLKPVNEISGAISSISSARASFDRINNILIEQEQPTSLEIPPFEVNGEIEFSNISFSFNKEKQIFKDFSCKINVGETIAITGKTGAGKTTLVNLLLKFLTPESGKILLDGNDISKINNTFLRQNIGIVQQEPFIYSGSIYYNIGFGKDYINKEEIEQIAKDLYAKDFISSLPNGFDTIVSNKTNLLSEGQKQLITICRAMYYNPKILILDEATSSIDMHSKILIEKAIKKLKQGKTTIMIAHNEDTINSADREIVIA
ncbi:MAG: ABC transporter ATP-binding protein [Clostridia bacterium]